jgi:hypothetical protein
MAQRQIGNDARLSAAGPAAVPQGAGERTAHNREALSFQARALIGLIEDLLKGDTKTVEVEPSLYTHLRLPGDNPDDALRYLLRGLRNELRNFDGGLKVMDRDPAAVQARLAPLHDLAVALVQVFGTAPESGAARAVLSMIGNLLDQAGLIRWPEFLRRFGGADAKPWAGLDISAYGRAEAPRLSRREAPDTLSQGKDKRKAKGKGKGKGKEKAEAKDKGKGKEKDKRKGRKNAFEGLSITPPAPVAGLPAPAAEAPKSPAAIPAAVAPSREPPAEDGAEDPLEIPLILVRPLQGDWARVLFKRGLDYLTRVYNEPPEKLRPILGNWVAQTGDDYRKVFQLLARAQTRKEPDPKVWVSNVLRQGGGAHGTA